MTYDKEFMSNLADIVIATRSLYFALDSMYDYLKDKDDKKNGYERQKRIAKQIEEGKF